MIQIQHRDCNLVEAMSPDQDCSFVETMQPVNMNLSLLPRSDSGIDMWEMWDHSAEDQSVSIKSLISIKPECTASAQSDSDNEDVLNILIRGNEEVSKEYDLHPGLSSDIENDMWTSVDMMWNSTVNDETEQLSQLLGTPYFSENLMADVKQELPDLSVVKHEIQESHSEDQVTCCSPESVTAVINGSSSSGIGSCYSSLSDDEELYQLDMDGFPGLDDEISNELFNELKDDVLLDALELTDDECYEESLSELKHEVESDTIEITDDEGEEVDIISVVEEVETIRSPLITFPNPQQLLMIQKVKLVANDHCYIPQVAQDWIHSAENPSEPSTQRDLCRPHMHNKRSNSKKFRNFRRGGRKNKLDISGQLRRQSLSGRRSNINYSREKREQLNLMERQRRIGLRSLYEELRSVIPEANPKAPNVQILKIATEKILNMRKQHEESEKAFEEEILKQKCLKRKLKYLQRLRCN